MRCRECNCEPPSHLVTCRSQPEEMLRHTDWQRRYDEQVDHRRAALSHGEGRK